MALRNRECHARIHILLDQYEKALEIFKFTTEKRSERFGAGHPDNVNPLSVMADLYRRLNRYELAGLTHKRAYLLGSKYFDPNHNDYFHIVTAYAVYLKEMGQLTTAKTIYDQQINPQLTNQRMLGLYLTYRAEVDIALGNFQQARQDLRQSEQILTRLFGDSLSYLYSNQLNLGFVMGLLGERQAGMDKLEQLYQQGSKQWGPKSLPMTSIKLDQATLSVKAGNYETAEQLIKFCIDIFEQHLDSSHPAYIDIYGAYTKLYMSQSQWRKALEYVDKQLQLEQQHYQFESLDELLSLLTKAEILWQLGEKQQAATLLEDNGAAAMTYLTPQSEYYHYITTLGALIVN